MEDDEGTKWLSASTNALKSWQFLPLVNAAEIALIGMNNSMLYVNFSQVKDLQCEGI